VSGTQLVVIAKAPVPGAVKTRLCPPYTLEQAADLAAAALADLVAAVSATPAARRLLLVDGHHPAPPAWESVPQRGDGLAARLAHAFQDLARPGLATLIVAGDAPQASPAMLATAADCLDGHPVDAVFGPTDDGGFWALGLRDPAHGELLHDVPMSTPTTGERTLDALRGHGLRVALLPRLRDVDTADDAAAVAAAYPHTRFAATVRAIRRHSGTFAA
jgi:rSAM/selenodomain-associated transferase 1